MMARHIRGNTEAIQERGLALLEVIMGLSIITLGLVGIERVLHERAHVRQQAAHIVDYRALVEHIAHRAAAHNTLFKMAEYERRIMHAADLRTQDLISAHVAERISFMGAARDYSVVFERLSGSLLMVHLVLYGGAVLDETRIHAVARPHLPRDGVDSRLRGLDDGIISEMRLVVSHATMLVPHARNGEAAIELVGEIPDALLRAYHLQPEMKAWWLHPEHSPVTFDIALKLLDGWTLETARAADKHMNVALPSCESDETPFVLATPKAALGPMRPAGAKQSYHRVGKEIVIADSAWRPTREIRIHPIEERQAYPVSLARMGDVALTPRDNPDALQGLGSDGLLRVAHGRRTGYGADFRGRHDGSSLLVSNHAFSLFDESVRTEFAYRAAIGVGQSGISRDSSLAGYTPPRARVRNGDTTEESAWRAGWVPPQAEHVRTDMTARRADVNRFVRDLKLSGHIYSISGPNVRFHTIDPANLASTYSHLTRTLFAGAIDAGETLDASTGDTDEIPEGALLLEPGPRIIAPQHGRVRLSAPAHVMPQAINADELIYACRSNGTCQGVEHLRTYKGYTTWRGIGDAARNDPAASKNKRPGGAFHFGKLHIHYPRSELNVSRLCL